MSGSDTYAAGYSYNASNVQVAAYWKNGILVTLAPLDVARNAVVNAIVVQ